MSTTPVTERRAARPLWTFLQDEKGTWSAARVFLLLWLSNAALFLWRHHAADAIGVALTFFTGIAVPLVVWAAGPRLAQYLAPQVGAATSAVADAAKALAAKVQARRDPATGVEISK